jgi:VanZ family protein
MSETKLGAGKTATKTPSPLSRTQVPAWAFLAFVVVFIIYGSLFPFDFRSPPESFDKLLERHNPFGNAADAIDNLLLFVPLGFALHFSLHRSRDRLIASVLAILSLGLGLQLLQLFLPSRTASLADVIWNSVGLAVGLLIASLARQWLIHRFATLTTKSPYALLLVLLWFFYETFPFTPTLDYGLLRAHVKTFIIAPPFEIARFVQHLLAAILCGIALQRSGIFKRSGRATALLGSSAVLLEIFVAYGSLRRETLIGICAGLAIGHLLANNRNRPTRFALATVAASAYLMTVFTPYRGQVADASFTLTPFSSFLWHNVTRDLPPLAFESLAIGALLWAGFFNPGKTSRPPVPWISFVFLAIVILEVIRVFVVGLHGDTTTILITVVLGTFAVTLRDANPDSADHQPEPSSKPRPSTPLADKPFRPAVAAHALSIALLAVLIQTTAFLPGTPYNVRELLPSGLDGIIAATCLAVAIYLGANSPFMLFNGEPRQRLVLFPLLLPLQGIIIWAMLRIGVPLESIHDIVGAPVLGWPWEWELLLRFLTLHQAIAMQMFGAVLLVATFQRPAQIAGFMYWLIASLLLSWPLHLVIVEWAATDNLTELMRDGGSFFASSLLAAGILLAFLGGTALGAALVDPARRGWLLLLALLSAPLAASCFLLGLEPVLVKYGKVFSAAQFLLSPDREHYLSHSTLLIRYILVHALVMAAIAIIQLRAWRTLTPETAKQKGTRSRRWQDGTIPPK